MKLLCLCLALLPLVMGGDVGGLWDKMQEEMMEKYEDMKDPMKGMFSGEKDENWGDRSVDEDEAEVRAKFEAWMEKMQEKEESGKGDYMEYMKKKVLSYSEYKKEQMYKKMQEEKAEAAEEKKWKMMQMRDMLAEKLNNVSYKYMDEMMDMKMEVAQHVVGLCQCKGNDNLDVLKWFLYGEDKDMDMGGRMGNGSRSSNSSSVLVVTSCVNGNCTNTTISSEQTVVAGVRIMNAREEARALLEVDQMEQVKHVVGDMVKVLCMAAGNYLDMLSTVAEYMKMD